MKYLHARCYALAGAIFLFSTTGCTGKAELLVPQNESANTALQRIIDEHWMDHLERNPVFATSIGVRDYDHRLADLSVKAMDDAAASAQTFLERVDEIDRALLSSAEQLNYDLLRLKLSNAIEGASFNGRLLTLTNRGGWHVGFARLPDRAPFLTAADYESYIARLNAFPEQNEQGMARLEAAIAVGYTQPCTPMAGYETSISTHIVDDVSASVFAAPFENMPASIPRETQDRLRSDGAAAIRDAVIPAYERLLAFYTETYAPNCRDASGLYGLDGADDFYAHRASIYTTTEMSPDEIHELGLSEVDRIRAEMETLIEGLEFNGDRKAFVEFLRSSEQFYANSEDELLHYTAYIAKKADGALPKVFTKFPRMPYDVRPVPGDIAEKTTTAYYEPPAGDGTRPGVYRVNLSKLDTRPLFEVEALTLHEGVPGHHFQIAIAQELHDLPEFRRYGGFIAFIEGWGLYAERLGLEMGFYENPYSDFGRLSYEMWRACRLVVDTGLHAKGWTRDEAIQFMTDNTALSIHNIEAEVDRYITLPGQALAYKVGELKIRQLRAKAKHAIGDDFDVRRFHDALLENGAVPLTILEALMDDWIAMQVRG